MPKRKKRKPDLTRCTGCGDNADPIKMLDGTMVPCLRCYHNGTRPTGRFSDRTLFAELHGDTYRTTKAPDALALDLPKDAEDRRTKLRELA